MKVGVLKEVKVREGRVAVIPENVVALTRAGHTVLVQEDAGVISGFSNEDYVTAGAKIVKSTKELIDTVDMVVKVKEPTIEEVKMMRPGQIFFGYLHLAAIPDTLKAILDQKIEAFGFETVELEDRSLPILSPMSEIAGKLATQSGSHFLRFDQGGRGVLLGGTRTVPPAKVLILGGGVVGQNAADIAVGMGANTTILEASTAKVELLRSKYGKKARVELIHTSLLESLVKEADLLVGGVLIVGEKAPKLVTEAMVKTMKKGSVIVDVSVDQGGCVETSEVTTHEKPVIVKHGVLHYGVANMPGAVPVTSTLALNHASFPYIQALADSGFEGVCTKYPEMKRALNCSKGDIVHPALVGIL